MSILNLPSFWTQWGETLSLVAIKEAQVTKLWIYILCCTLTLLEWSINPWRLMKEVKMGAKTCRALALLSLSDHSDLGGASVFYIASGKINLTAATRQARGLWRTFKEDGCAAEQVTALDWLTLRVRPLRWFHFALIYGITEQPSCSELGSNISGSDWRTALIPPINGIHATSNVERCGKTNDHRGENKGGGSEKTALKTRGLQDWLYAALWPLTLKNWTRFHPCYTWGKVSNSRDLKEKFHHSYFSLPAKWKMIIINRRSENE